VSSVGTYYGNVICDQRQNQFVGELDDTLGSSFSGTYSIFVDLPYGRIADAATCAATTLDAQVEVLVYLPSLQRSAWFTVINDRAVGQWNAWYRQCSARLSVEQSGNWYEKFRITAKAIAFGVPQDMYLDVIGAPPPVGQ